MPRTETFESNPEMEARLLVQWSAFPMFGPHLLLLCPVAAHSEFNVSKVLPCQRSWYRSIFYYFCFSLQEQPFRDTDLYVFKPLANAAVLGAWGIFLERGVRLLWKWMISAKGQGMQAIQGNFKFIFFHLFPNTTTHLHFFLYWPKTSFPFLFTVTFF